MLAYLEEFFTPEVLNRVLQAEQNLGSHKTPFDSLYKFEAISRKTSDVHQRLWCIDTIVDMVSEAPAVRGELSSRSLSGKGQGGKGKIDEFLLRYQMKNYMVNT